LETFTPTKASIRVGVDENSKIHYLLTRKGTPQPTKGEIVNVTRKDNPIYNNLGEELGMTNVKIMPGSSTYSYHDSLIELK
jgi:hypothetical protein